MAGLSGSDGPYLADACAVIAFVADAAMSKAMRTIMSDGDVCISPVTVWEITRKASLGLLPKQWNDGGLAGHLQRLGFRPLPLVWIDAEQANDLPPLHKDPMDRMLIAQALRHDMCIITSDRIFAAYGVRTIW